MPRYIDADEFRKRIDQYPPDIRDTAKKELRYTPTADVVKVVRCKDCKHSRTDDVFGGRWCQFPESIKRVREEFFCANGERKVDD